MGMCVVKGQTQKNQEIEAQLRKYRKQRSSDLKILLLGPGESGKSTVFKQLKIIQDGGGFTEQERKNYTHVVHSNCVTQMRLLAEVTSKTESFDKDEDILTAISTLTSPLASNSWTPEIGLAIKKLWEVPAIKRNYPVAAKTSQLNETAIYFFENISRFIEPDYIPSQDDVLRVRTRSTGIEEAEFKFDNNIYKVVDVGGQRSERRKWIHCFDCVTTVLFCASLSGYDQTLREDHTINRMEEAMNLFDEMINSPCFQQANMILFLNKTDLFQEKIKETDLTVNELFCNYTGGADFHKACDYIEARFRERVANGTQLFVHFTCAILTENIDHVIDEVRIKVLNNTIKDFYLD